MKIWIVNYCTSIVEVNSPFCDLNANRSHWQRYGKGPSQRNSSLVCQCMEIKDNLSWFTWQLQPADSTNMLEVKEHAQVIFQEELGKTLIAGKQSLSLKSKFINLLLLPFNLTTLYQSTGHEDWATCSSFNLGYTYLKDDLHLLHQKNLNQFLDKPHILSLDTSADNSQSIYRAPSLL